MPASEAAASADTLTRHARYLTIARQSDGNVHVDITNPWNDAQYLARYLLVDIDSALPQHLSPDVKIVRTPVRKAAVYSAIHTSALEELGAIDIVRAVADGKYFRQADTISTLINSGKIIDVGPVASPSVERLAASGAQVVLRSPLQDAVDAALPPGVVAVECVDYLETTPIARAEWLLLLGVLAGKTPKATSIFSDVIDRYSYLTSQAAATSYKPKVLVETEQSGIWYVPAGNSYMARLLTDAGADYPWTDTEGTGSLPLSLESVAQKALDADVWLVRTFGFLPSQKYLKALSSRYTAFKAFKDNEIYGCDTSVAPFYNDLAFHPERILADYVAILHPEIMNNYCLKYYHKAK